jgi:AcrR family transcriptional regulator
MPTREEAKEQRRDRILIAARELVREKGKTGFSMRALAQGAELSLVTPYNLFGSKQAIMYALLDEDLQQYGSELARSKKDPLDMLFRAVTLGKLYFSRDQEYYKAIFSSVYTDGGAEYRSMFRGPRRELWAQLVKDAVDERFLESETDPRAFALNLASIYFANILEWVAGEISLREMEVRTHYGFALALHSLAGRGYKGRLREEVRRAQRRIRRLPKVVRGVADQAL